GLLAICTPLLSFIVEKAIGTNFVMFGLLKISILIVDGSLREDQKLVMYGTESTPNVQRLFVLMIFVDSGVILEPITTILLPLAESSKWTVCESAVKNNGE